MRIQAQSTEITYLKVNLSLNVVRISMEKDYIISTRKNIIQNSNAAYTYMICLSFSFKNKIIFVCNNMQNVIHAKFIDDLKTLVIRCLIHEYSHWKLSYMYKKKKMKIVLYSLYSCINTILKIPQFPLFFIYPIRAHA